jgi:hypothetical protein
MAQGDKAAAATWNAMVGGGALESSSVRREWLKSADKALASLAVDRKQGWGMKDGRRIEGDEYEKYANEQEAELNTIRDKLLDSDSTTLITGSANITATNVTVTGKVE